MLIVIGFILGLGIFGVFLFNRLVRDRNLVKEGWAGIDVQLKRRHDVIPKLVQTVQSYSTYEKRLLEKVSSLRGESQNAGSFAAKEKIEKDLSQNLIQIIGLAEAYPALRADHVFLELQKNISDTENQLQLARRYYNGAVRNYNIRAASFPSFLVAMLFGFKPADYFQADENDRKEDLSSL